MVTLTRSQQNTSLQPHFHYSPPHLLVTATPCHHTNSLSLHSYSICHPPLAGHCASLPTTLQITAPLNANLFPSIMLPLVYPSFTSSRVSLLSISPHPVSLHCLCAMHSSHSRSKHVHSTSYTPPQDPLSNPSPMVCVGCSLVSLPWALDGLVPALAALIGNCGAYSYVYHHHADCCRHWGCKHALPATEPAISLYCKGEQMGKGNVQR